MADEGYIPIGRGFFEHAFWSEQRVYSRAEAWLDLIQEAAWKPRKKIVSGVLVEVPRGGIVAAVRFLCDRWGWSNTKVCLFLDLLRSEGMIKTEKRQGNSVHLLCKYDEYNPEKRQENDAGTTPGRRRDDKEEEGNKERRKGEGSECASELRTDRLPSSAVSMLGASACPKPIPAQAESAEAVFQRFWLLYPKKERRLDALGAYQRNGCLAISDEVMAGLKRWLASDSWREPRFATHAHRWLDGKMWEDEPCAAGAAMGGSNEPSREGYTEV